MNQLAPVVAGQPEGFVRDLLDANPMVGERRAGRHRFWTMRELKTLRENYPTAGVDGCLALLPGRTASSIYNRANLENLVRLTPAGSVPAPRRHWTWSEQQDATIRSVYDGKPKRGDVTRLSKVLGRPKHVISQRALALGLTLPRFKELPWSDAELDVLKELGSALRPQAIQRALKQRGFSRTPTAIKVKVKRLSIYREVDENHYTANGLAIALGIDRKRVATFVERGWLKAKKVRHSAGDLETANWQIHQRDVRAFVIDNVAVIDFKKVDKFWLVDLLVHRPVGGSQ